MRTAEWIQIGFAFVLAVAAWAFPLPLRRRLNVTLLASIVIAAILTARALSRFLSGLASSVVHDWLPAALLLLPYWQIGQFFTSPDAELQRKLAALDRRLLPSRPIAKRLSGILEIAYLGVYPLVPLALGVLYAAGRRADADYYWTVVLFATYICYAMTPFFPALPPRSLAPVPFVPDVPQTAPRRLNVWIVRNASIGAITFPSAHVASALAASLVLLRLVPVAGVVFGSVSVGICFACVLGRYHYAADVLAGIVVAVFAFACTFGLAAT